MVPRIVDSFGILRGEIPNFLNKKVNGVFNQDHFKDHHATFPNPFAKSGAHIYIDVYNHYRCITILMTCDDMC